MKKEQISLKNNVEELNKLNSFVEDLLAKWQLPGPLGMNLNLALEEVFSNIVFYAYDDQKEHEVLFAFENDGEKLHVTVSDDGKAFDPLQTPPPDDLDKPPEERHIGGLGIFFVRSVMDELGYQRKDDKNILKLTKKIKA
ncbi:MAG: ATP-binding protein [Bacteroidota bacterium]|nr:ATP-binding protein [Bacteroidota bacterium]